MKDFVIFYHETHTHANENVAFFSCCLDNRRQHLFYLAACLLVQDAFPSLSLLMKEYGLKVTYLVHIILVTISIATEIPDKQSGPRSEELVLLISVCVPFCRNFEIRPRGYKTFFMLNSTEHELFPAHKC